MHSTFRSNIASTGVACTKRKLDFRRNTQKCKAAVVGSDSTKAPFTIVDNNVLQSITKQQYDIIRSMDDFIGTEVGDQYLAPIGTVWQPQDLLPDPTSESFVDDIKDLRARCQEMPNDYLVALAGDMITEEALPTYMNMLNTLDGVRDISGFDATNWAKWTRQWTAEENRHGDAMNKYMWLTGRVDLRAIEVTIHKLITHGMNPKTDNNPFYGYIYTSFQERATKISHGNTARFAKKYGDIHMARLCGLVASDEARHMHAYVKIVDEFFNRDRDNTLIAFSKMMKDQIAMPAMFMDDEWHESANGSKLFSDFSAVAERLGVYTAADYSDIMRWLIAKWKVPSMTGLSAEALEAQQYLCALPDRIQRVGEKALARKTKKM